MIFKKNAILLMVIFILFSKCSKKSSIPPLPPTELELTIVDDPSGVPANGATVKLFLSQDDWKNKTNVLSTQTADASGSVTFSNLSSRVYYWYAEWMNCRNNTYEFTHTASAIPEFVKTQINCTVEATGTLKFVNNSSSSFRVDVNGVTFYPSMPGGATYSQVIGIGNYDIHVVEIGGSGRDQAYTGTLTCGLTLVTTFP